MQSLAAWCRERDVGAQVKGKKEGVLGVVGWSHFLDLLDYQTHLYSRPHAGMLQSDYMPQNSSDSDQEQGYFDQRCEKWDHLDHVLQQHCDNSNTPVPFSIATTPHSNAVW